MAHSPALLDGYLGLSRAMKRVRIPRALSEKLSLAVQEWIGCGTCREAHIEAGHGEIPQHRGGEGAVLAATVISGRARLRRIGDQGVEIAAK